MSKPVHWEIPSTDVPRSAAFYAAMFGWEMQGWNDDYTLFSVPDGMGGGISKVDAMPAAGLVVYISVDDIDAALAKAESLGARTAQAKTEIGGGMGCWAAFEDPCGCRMCIWAAS
jgi:uncharacterized protein